MAVNPPRRWYQFSLKTLLVLLTLLCLGPGGFVAYEQNRAWRQKGAVAAIEELGGAVGYCRAVPVRSAMLRRILGDDTFAVVESVDFWNPSRVTDADLKHLASLSRLKTLHLDNSQVTDGGLKQLAGLKDLSVLYLDNSQVTDGGLAHLTGLKTLRILYVRRTKVTDTGVAELRKSLPDCQIRR
jgi:hypothetical protein